MKRRTISVLLVVLMASFAVRATAQESPLVRLSFSSGWDALPAIVGIERGLFSEEGLLVSGLAITSATAALRSIGVGSSDFAAVPQRTFLVAAASSLPVKAISLNGWGTKTELVVPKGAQDLNGVADLKGKSVGVGNGSEAFPVLMRLLNQARLQPGDVQIRLLTADQLTSAFKNNLADAVFESQHFTKVLVDGGQARHLLTADQVVGTLGVIGAQALITRNEMIEKSPITVQRFVNGWVRALNYINEDPDDAARLLIIFFHRQGVVVRDEQAREWVEMTRYDRFVWTQNDIADAEYNGWGLTIGQVLREAPKIAGFIDNSFAEKASAGLVTAKTE